MLLLSRAVLQSHPVLLCSQGWGCGSWGSCGTAAQQIWGDLSHPSCDASSAGSVMPSPHSWLRVGVAWLMHVSIFIAFLTRF